MKFKKRNIQIVDHSTGQTLDFPTFGKPVGEEAIKDLEKNIDNKIAGLKNLVGSPLQASTISAMTNEEKIYVYTGNESGYTNGHWYYYNGTTWTDGGVYNSVAIETDKTLSVEDMPADAKKTGDEINELKEDLSRLEKPRTYIVSATLTEPKTYVYPINIPKGYTVLIKNLGSIMTVNVSDGNNTVNVVAGVSQNRSAFFVCPIDATQIRTYVNGTDCHYEIIVTSTIDRNITKLLSIAEVKGVVYADISEFKRGAWDGDDVLKEAETIRLSWTKRVFVTSNDAFYCNTGDLYVNYSLWDGNGNRSYNSGWVKGIITHTFSFDGYLQVMFANSQTYNESTNIYHADYDAVTCVLKKDIISKELFDKIDVIDGLEKLSHAISTSLNGSSSITIEETVTANTSYNFDAYIPTGSIVSFVNEIESSTCTLNVSDGTNETNISNSVGRGRVVTFTAPFDIVRFRCYVAGTSFKANVSWKFGEIAKISTELYFNNESYFDAEINDTVSKLITACEEKSIVFPIITDSHNYYDGWDNWSATQKNLYHLNRKYRMDFLSHLGDMIEGNADKATSESYLMQVVSDFLRINPSVVTLTGNHEDNHRYYNDNGTGLINDVERYALLNRYNDTMVQRVGTNQYFYFEFLDENMPIRVVCLNGLLGDGFDHGNSGTAWGYTDEEIAWVRDVALDTTKQVVFLSHVPLSSIYSKHYDDGFTIHNSDGLLTVISNFILNGGVVVGFFCGHTHMDFMAVNSIGIHEVQTGCQNMNQSPTAGSYSYSDGAYTPTVPARSRGTVSQELWDIVVISPIARKVTMIRFGAGNDRAFSY